MKDRKTKNRIRNKGSAEPSDFTWILCSLKGKPWGESKMWRR